MAKTKSKDEVVEKLFKELLNKREEAKKMQDDFISKLKELAEDEARLDDLVTKEVREAMELAELEKTIG
jgi:hypothetical protein